MRQQASPPAASFSTSSPFKTFLRGRGAVVLYGIPTNACLIAPQYPVWHPTSQYRAGAVSISTTTLSRPGVICNLRTISKYEGRAGLFAGLRPTLLAVVPNATIYLSAYDEITSRLKRYNRSSRSSSSTNSDIIPRKMHTLRGGSNDTAPWIPFVAGASARLVASVATGKFIHFFTHHPFSHSPVVAMYLTTNTHTCCIPVAPLELVRTRQASATNGSARSQRTILDEFRLLLRTSGPTGLYRGLVPMVLRDVPFSAIYFATLESCRTGLSESKTLGTWGTRYYIENNVGEIRPPVRVDVLEAFLAAVVAGSIATIFTTPFDVVKTRRMTIRLSSSSSPIRTTSNQMIIGRSPSSLFGHMRLIVKEEGIVNGLWRGNSARMIKVAPGMALMISSYELGKRLLEDVM